MTRFFTLPLVVVFLTKSVSSLRGIPTTPRLNHLHQKSRLSTVLVPTAQFSASSLTAQFSASCEALSHFARSGTVRASTNAVAKLVSCVGLGYWAAEHGTLNTEACGVVSRLVLDVFAPALLFANVASNLATPGQDLSTLGIIPLFCLGHIFIGSCIGEASLPRKSQPSQSVLNI